MSMTRGGATYFFYTNAHGDIISVTNASGNKVAEYKYDPWGKLISSTGGIENPFRYAGYYYDTETGLYYLQSRYYSPELCRFLTKDSIEGMPGAPKMHNLYVYCTDNPSSKVDPVGLWGDLLHEVITWQAAFRVGFSLGGSVAMRYGNYLMDQSPYWSLTRKYWYIHFNTSTSGIDSRMGFLYDMISNARRYLLSGDWDIGMNRLGRGLHALQDMYAHGDVEPYFHLPAYDWPEKNSQNYINSVLQTEETLWDFCASMGCTNGRELSDMYGP